MFYSFPVLPRTAEEVVFWASCLPEGPWNIWCENVHSSCFLKLVFIHRRRILLIMPSMRHSYTVTIPEEPPATAFPLLKQDMRRKNSMSGSMLVSTFVGLLINHAKVWTRFMGVSQQFVLTFIHLNPLLTLNVFYYFTNFTTTCSLHIGNIFLLLQKSHFSHWIPSGFVAHI